MNWVVALLAIKTGYCILLMEARAFSTKLDGRHGMVILPLPFFLTAATGTILSLFSMAMIGVTLQALQEFGYPLALILTPYVIAFCYEGIRYRKSLGKGLLILFASTCLCAPTQKVLADGTQTRIAANREVSVFPNEASTDFGPHGELLYRRYVGAEATVPTPLRLIGVKSLKRKDPLE